MLLTPVLVIYDPQLHAKDIADALSYGIGAVIVQKHLEGTYLEASSIHIEGIFKYGRERVVGHDMGEQETGNLFDQQDVSH